MFNFIGAKLVKQGGKSDLMLILTPYGIEPYDQIIKPKVMEGKRIRF